ncbi:MAG TPA: hypothetical protein VF952_00020 [Chloroflexia bacterium]
MSANTGVVGPGSGSRWFLPVFLLVLGVLTGLCMAIGQAIFLETQVRVPDSHWVSLSTLGSGVGILVANLPYFFGENPRGNAVVAALLAGAGGALLGASQWLALRKASTLAVWWIPASALAWGAGQMAVFLVENIWPISGTSDPLPSGSDAAKMLGYPLIIPAVASVLLGVVVARIIQAPAQPSISAQPYKPAPPPHSTSPS